MVTGTTRKSWYASIIGIIDVRNAPPVIESIRRGVDLARSGEASALVTSPIQKSALYAAGFGFPGHTEFLEHLAGEPFRSPGAGILIGNTGNASGNTASASYGYRMIRIGTGRFKAAARPAHVVRVMQEKKC